MPPSTPDRNCAGCRLFQKWPLCHPNFSGESIPPGVDPMESGQIHPTFESVCRRYQELDSDEDLSAVELEALLKAEIGEVEDSDREDSAHERIHKSWDWRTIKGVARKKPSPKSDQT